MSRITRTIQSTAHLAVVLVILATCGVSCAAVTPETNEASVGRVVSTKALPIRLPADPKCPWLSEGVVGAAQASPLVKAIVARTRMAAPFGPGSWPERFLTLPDETTEQKYGWSKAAVFALIVNVDEAQAQKWLPDNLLQITKNATARVFFAWYPDSFCCGAYHEVGIVLNVTHVESGAKAAHCPWMLVDLDRSMIAGREILGFPKKMGEFEFTLNGEDIKEMGEDKIKQLLGDIPGDVEIKATVSRGGATLINATGIISGSAPEGTTAFGGVANVPLTFLNVQTNHPLPPNDLGTEDQACVGNRPRLLQFTFDEFPVSDQAWRVSDASVVLNATKTDNIAKPFMGIHSEVNDDTQSGSSQTSLSIQDATFSVTNFYTGLEQTPSMGGTVPQGYVEDDDLYWLRYQ